MTTTDPRTATEMPPALATNPVLSRWLRVRADGVVELCIGKVELGQGILTAAAQLAADGLGLPLESVVTVPATTANGPDLGFTAGSRSVQEVGPAVRAVTRQVRALFAAEAAHRLGCGADEVSVAGGRFEAPDGGSIGYGDLAPQVPLDVPARHADDAPAGRRLAVGTSAARLDLPDKLSGRPSYIGDLRLPGMLHGRVVRPPSPSARLDSVRADALDGMAVEVVRDGSFVGVVGADEWVVDQALQRLAAAAEWTEQDDLPDEDDLAAFLRAGPHDVTPLLDEGTADPSATGVRHVRATYSKPFHAHASMAPSGAAAHWQDGSVHVWSHSQGIYPLRAAIAQAVGLDPGRVTVEHVQNAGCYGHNGADDAAFDAVLLARAVPGRPVLLRWSRGDELAWSPFGSAMVADVAATVSESGRVTSWRYDVWSQGHASRPGYAGTPGLLASRHLADPFDLPAATDPPYGSGGGTLRNAVPLYDVGPRRVTAHRLTRTPLRTSAVRSLGSFFNVFAIESLMDEIACEAGLDPLAHRLDHLSDPRAREVLERAAAAGDWRAPKDDGIGRGLAVARYKNAGAYCAVVAEVEAVSDVRVRRLVLAVDVGQVVNPDGVRSQVEGGAVQATSWATKERVRFDRRRVTSIDWESYPILRFSETPEVQVVLVDRPDLPSVGAGECAQGPTAAAVANAVADAVGVRVRDLPITPAAVVAAIEAEIS